MILNRDIRNSGIFENQGTTLWNFVPNSKLSPRHVDRRNVLSTVLDKGGRSL